MNLINKFISHFQHTSLLDAPLTITRGVAAEPALLDNLEHIRHAKLPQLVIRKQVAVF